MKPLSLIITAFVILFNTQTSFGQKKDNVIADSLVKHFYYYKISKQRGILFAHFDKNVYTNNENVWFTAYSLNNAAKNDVLSVILLKDDSRSIVLQTKFVMNNGIAFGSLFLPDSVRSGNYSFLLYVNTIINSKPADVFVQPITVKNTSHIVIKASMILLDTEKNPKDGFRRILLTANTTEGKTVKDASVKYYTGHSAKPFMSGVAKTDKNGECIIKVPTAKLVQENNILYAQINRDKDETETKLTLPVSEHKFSVRFYPEGGYLSEGIRSTIGWEVKNSAGAPYTVAGVLYCNNKAIDTISVNDYGLGRFSLVPNSGCRYDVRLLAGPTDSVFNLPGAVKELPVITVPRAIANDTLNLSIRSSRHSRVYLIIHNFKDCFTVFPVLLNTSEKKIIVPLDDIPKGLTEVTLLDSAMKPLAERVFFAHYNKRINLNIATDKEKYGTRDKVSVKVRLSDLMDEHKPLSGLVSIACVQRNRLETKKTINIDRYLYLSHDIGELPERESYLGEHPGDKEFLENILLIKGWRRYSWTELVKTNSSDTLLNDTALKFSGAVTLSGKTLKKPLLLIIRKDSMLSTFQTGNNGEFSLPDEYLVLHPNKKIYIYINGKHTEDYSIIVHDPYGEINDNLAKTFMPVDYEKRSVASPENQQTLEGFEHSVLLKEVKITANKDNLLYGATNANPCGDYICRYNILNCANHRFATDNRPAKLGETYKVYDSNGTFSNLQYNGCFVPPPSNNIVKINGIYYPMVFYPSDYNELSPSQPEYLSTIYWKYLSRVSSDADLNFSFFTSDVTGDFKIVIQGITENDVLYGEKVISVKK